MRVIGRTAALLVVLTTFMGCGSDDPEVMTVSMMECVYQGPRSMDAGDARITLTLHGLGMAGVSLLELGEGRTYDDLEDHFESVDAKWEERPPWTTSRALLRASDETVSSRSTTITLSAGSYALVCIDYPYGDGDAMARVAASVTVDAK